MQFRWKIRASLGLAFGVSVVAWGQGGRNPGGRAAAAPQGSPESTAARGGRGGGAAAGEAAGAVELYQYDPAAGGGRAIPDTPPKETQQKMAVNGQALGYTARAGFLPLRNATTGQSEAHLFYTSYFKDGDAAGRPIVFFVGGAPGVATAWQEFGGLGPKRMKSIGEGGGGPPYGWSDNPGTLLGQADLVFVNPVGTAFSRADQPSRSTSFWNTAGDTASLGEFVRGFVSAYNRRNSPLFVAGEDAATGRAAGVAGYLEEHQVPVRGVILLSMMMSADATAGDTQYLTLLPSLAMTAWRHKKLAPELNAMSAEQIAGQARQFASREYLHALYKGERLTAEERAKAIAGLARLTGLSKAFVVNNDLRIPPDRFGSELLRGERQEPAKSDARVTGFAPPPAFGGRGGRGGFGAAVATPIDFNFSRLAGGFLTAYESYLQRELSFGGGEPASRANAGDGVFYLMSGGVQGFAATGNDDASLANAFARNPRLRLFVAVNYYDLGAPFYATEYTVAHLNVSPEVRAHHITVSHYEAGQMTYADDKGLAQLQRDLSSFLTEATKE